MERERERTRANGERSKSGRAIERTKERKIDWKLEYGRAEGRGRKREREIEIEGVEEREEEFTEVSTERA